PVVGHDQAALDAVAVHVLEEVLRPREVVDDGLHRVVEAVERPGLDLADVAVPVDHVPLDAVRQGHGRPPGQGVSSDWRMRAIARRHASGSVNSWRGASGGSSRASPVSGSSWTASTAKRGSIRSGSISVMTARARPVATDISTRR